MIEKLFTRTCPPLKAKGKMANSVEVRITVLLPDEYYETEERYPVCYVPDGSMLTAERDGVKLHDRYQKSAALLPKVIYIGIDPPGRGEVRSSAYGAPINTDLFLCNIKRAELFALGGCGDRFADWIADVIKPEVDATYRTKPGREDTGIMGFSSGGTLAILAGMLRSETFSRIGAFSPSTWAWSGWFYGVMANLGYRYSYTLSDGEHHEFTAKVDEIRNLYVYQGGQDGSSGNDEWALYDVKNVYRLMIEAGAGTEAHRLDICQEGTHGPLYWSQYMESALRTLYPDYI